MIGFEDFGPSLLGILGLDIPGHMTGRDVLSAGSDPKEYQFLFRTNHGSNYDPAHAVTDGRYFYVRFYRPHKPLGLRQGYQWGLPGYQAEFAEFEGAEVETAGRDYHGMSYVTFRGKEGWIRWYQENDGSAGNFHMRFRYAINDRQRGGRNMELYINGRKVEELEFENIGHWNREWRTVDTVRELDSGADIIELRTRGHSGPNLDELRVLD